MGNIKRGVSLYSYQQEYYLRQMTLEDCVRAVADLGADGIELITEAMMPEFPNPSDAFIDEWFGLMDKYRVKPTAYDAFIELKLHKNRLMSEDELLAEFVRDIRLAKRMGFENIRVLSLALRMMNVVERAIPYAEEAGIRLGIEIHSPIVLKTPVIDQVIELALKKNTKHLGVTPDMGIFVHDAPRVLVNRRLREGGTPELIAWACDAYRRKLGADATADYVAKAGGNEHDLAFAREVFHYVGNDPQDIIPYIPHMVHVHAKFYEMTEECDEPSIAYKPVVDLLKAHGWSGYLSSEYEGQRHWHDVADMSSDSVEEVRRHHVLLKRLIGE